MHELERTDQLTAREAIRLSIVMPTNRCGPSPYARIIRACSWASDGIEVIVRDNSEDGQKRKFLSNINGQNISILHAKACDIYSNFKESFREARGEFVLFMADDDDAFDRGIDALAQAAGRLASDLSVVGLTGTYVLEQSTSSQLVTYGNLDSYDVARRVDGYLSYQGPNVIFYSAIRRSLAWRAWEFLISHPFRLSFHDNLLPIIYLMGGRYININRLAIINDNRHWENRIAGEQSDLKFYTSAGLDPAMRQLQWMICGFEGASVIMLSEFGAHLPPAQRTTIANRWCEVMYRRFLGDTDRHFDSKYAGKAAQLHAKWRQQFPRFELAPLLDDISDFIALFSPEKAKLYHDFWKSSSSVAVR